MPPRSPGQRRFERRIDERTAGDIADALRARGVQAQALALEHLHVDVDLALRVLAGKRERRNTIQQAVRTVCADRQAWRRPATTAMAAAGTVAEPG